MAIQFPLPKAAVSNIFMVRLDLSVPGHVMAVSHESSLLQRAGGESLTLKIETDKMLLVSFSFLLPQTPGEWRSLSISLLSSSTLYTDFGVQQRWCPANRMFFFFSEQIVQKTADGFLLPPICIKSEHQVRQGNFSGPMEKHTICQKFDLGVSLWHPNQINLILLLPTLCSSVSICEHSRA